MPTIITLVEKRRGCGYRKPGGYYLIGSGGPALGCCRLPYLLTSCPCCGNEIKFTRGFQWITNELFNQSPARCLDVPGKYPGSCPLVGTRKKIGLMWVGEQFYPTPADFTAEAEAQGVSKRVGTIPKDCKPGTWVALAHRKSGLKQPDEVPVVFMVFRIQSIDYVVTGKETDDELAELENQGYRLVNVIPEGTQLTTGI